jgi:hypothetical protein
MSPDKRLEALRTSDGENGREVEVAIAAAET